MKKKQYTIFNDEISSGCNVKSTVLGLDLEKDNNYIKPEEKKEVKKKFDFDFDFYIPVEEIVLISVAIMIIVVFFMLGRGFLNQIDSISNLLP